MDGELTNDSARTGALRIDGTQDGAQGDCARDDSARAGAMSAPIVEVRNLVKRYGDVVALDHFDLRIEPGEIFGLLGPNGSGKTTAINCILQLLTFDKGDICLFGEPMTPTRYDLKRKIGVVPQNVALFEELTVRENIDFFCALYVDDRRERARLVDEAIAFVGLEDYVKFRPRKLSGGLLRRLNIACGIAHNYLAENYPGGCPHPVLKISQYPLPASLVRRMASECGSLLIIEEGQPVVEQAVRGILPAPLDIRGRMTGQLPRTGELAPDSVRAAVGLAPHATHAASQIVVPRPPALCQGCGHRDVYTALKEIADEYENAKVFSDIGCYTLGWLAPFHAIDTCVDMGASITMAKGAADAGVYPSIAVIGDSTFTHSGMTGLLDAVNERSNITVIISDNLTTGMTGGQDSAGTGRLEQICAGIGVDPAHIRTVVPLPKNREEMKAVIREEIAHRGVSVIIPRRECIQTAKRHNAAKK